MSQLARNFAGGTDNIKSGSSFTFASKNSCFFRTNISTADTTARRCDGGGMSYQYDGTPGFFYVVASGWTTAGVWHIPMFSTGAEHDILVTYDAGSTSNTPIIYLDGTSQTVTLQTAPTGSWAPTAAQFFIGNRADLSKGWIGWIEMFAIWSDILSSGNATSLHGGTPPCAIRQDILAHYWPLDKGESPEPDVVGGNDGTVTGATTTSGSTIAASPRCGGRTPRDRVFSAQALNRGIFR